MVWVWSEREKVSHIFLLAMSDSWRALTRSVISSRLSHWELVVLSVLADQSSDFTTVFGRVIFELWIHAFFRRGAVAVKCFVCVIHARLVASATDLAAFQDRAGGRLNTCVV